jgi:hypothetical protein
MICQRTQYDPDKSNRMKRAGSCGLWGLRPHHRQRDEGTGRSPVEDFSICGRHGVLTHISWRSHCLSLNTAFLETSSVSLLCTPTCTKWTLPPLATTPSSYFVTSR